MSQSGEICLRTGERGRDGFCYGWKMATECREKGNVTGRGKGKLKGIYAQDKWEVMCARKC